MNTLTKEWLQNTITGIESIIDDKSFVCSEIAFEIGQVNNILTAFKIALASLAAKPVVYMWDSERKDIDAPGYYRTEHLVFAESSVKKWGGRVVPLYTAPPATVVPDERAAFNAWNNDENLPIAGVGAKNAAWLAWQARAELGRSLAVNSPVTPDGWISCSDRMPEKGQNVLISVNFDSSLVEPLICSARYTGSTFRRGDATIKLGNGIEQLTGCRYRNRRRR